MKEMEVRRQIFHVALGIALVALLYFDVLRLLGNSLPLSPLPAPARPLLVVLVVGLILVLLSKKYRVPAVHWFLKKFGRPEETKVFPGKGPFFYILGAFIVILLFERNIAMASLIILALGDPVSHLIGMRMGRVRHPFSSTKFIEGHVAGAIIGALGAMLFVSPPRALLAASVAMFVEGVDVGFGINRILDDNLVVPLVAGAVLFLAAPVS